MQSVAARAHHLRVARPVTDLHRSTRMYCEGLAFEIIDAFENHDGFDGVMIGTSGTDYHIELTRQRAQAIIPRSTVEDLLVFYIATEPEWQDACNRMRHAGFRAVMPHNPYWGHRACVFVDHDGYHVALHRGAWARDRSA